MDESTSQINPRKGQAKSFARINVFLKEKFDFSFRSFEQRVQKKLGQDWIEAVRSIKSYLFYGVFSLEELESIAQEILTDPILEKYSINQPPEMDSEFQYQLEIGYLPGVVDNEARTILSGLEDLLPDFDPETQVFTLQILNFQLNVDRGHSDLKDITEKYLTNGLIESSKIIDQDGYRVLSTSYQDGSWQKDWEFLLPRGVRGVEKTNKTEKVNSNLNPYYRTIPIQELAKAEDGVRYAKEHFWYFTREELEVIAEYFRQDSVREDRKNWQLPPEPTDLEIEVLAQTWSEHCKHKIFAADINYQDEKGVTKISSLYKTYIQATTKELAKHRSDLISVFTDNSGIFSFNQDWAICMKVETHNSPSALDPFGGAITGILGVNRDIMGTGIGAEPLFNTDVFCFARPDYDRPIPGVLKHPRRIFQGVHHGVERGGNESGIPTVNGAILFDDRFLGKPLVFCGTGGLIPKVIEGKDELGKTIKVDTSEKYILPGDLIVVVGGRVGKDGIHGATFSSEGLEESTPASVVQIGDSIMQRKVLDFLIKARDQLMYRTLTDNGAGGISSSVGEMATLVRSEKKLGGCEIHLDNNHLKYPGLQPWEIMVSESQERMSLAVPVENKEKLQELADLYDVELNFIGKFNDSGYLTTYFHEQVVGRLELNFLHDGVPVLKLQARWEPPPPTLSLTGDVVEEKLQNHPEILRGVLSHPNIASKEYWVRQYDHEVKARTVLKPFDGEEDAPMDAAVVKPLFESDQGIVVSNGIIPSYSDYDAYQMAANAVDEAVRNLVAVGGNPSRMVGLDNFCWPDPIVSSDNLDGAHKLAQLVRANQALHETCLVYNLPLISGKDSMKNDYGKGKEKISIPPTLLVTALTTIDDINQLMTSNFKAIDSVIYLVGGTKDELGGSIFEQQLKRYLNTKESSEKFKGFMVPVVDTGTNRQTFQLLYQSIRKGSILACHDLSEGGLAVALAESSFGGMIGAEIDLEQISLSAELDINKTLDRNFMKLYSESAGRFLVEVSRNKVEEFEAIFQQGGHGNTGNKTKFFQIGRTEAHDRLVVKSGGATLIDEDLDELKSIWKNALIF